ncbi:hypothetical protein GCM10017056_32750 [Seohaeicola zhoushanensis]|uniref:DUF2059 domain-containing protein n=2 Tax=Seohaeicola zhoushanensis TaxID=1569283 RepID=A0A8J3M8F4_9RHOB|nr:hypothetical protein GCM10017056_32750 [Seohaeicola zhoushanensis]
MFRPLSCLVAFLGLALMTITAPSPSAAAERARIEAFLNVTGFDVALDSIALSAKSAPRMLGLEAEDFGIEWTRMADDVFAPGVMRGLALDILEQTLDDDMLHVAVDFYSSDLGQKLVQAENTAHVTDDDIKADQGEQIVADLVRTGSPRLELFKRMSQAIGGAETAVRAMQEIQLRFLMSASAAGVVNLKVDADELRGRLKSQEGAMLRSVQKSGLAASALTYRDFTDEELTAYADALEGPEMRKVYELLNAVQYEITANRFEALAARMANLQPQQDL